VSDKSQMLKAELSLSTPWTHTGGRDVLLQSFLPRQLTEVNVRTDDPTAILPGKMRPECIQ